LLLSPSSQDCLSSHACLAHNRLDLSHPSPLSFFVRPSPSTVALDQIIHPHNSKTSRRAGTHSHERSLIPLHWSSNKRQISYRLPIEIERAGKTLRDSTQRWESRDRIQQCCPSPVPGFRLSLRGRHCTPLNISRRLDFNGALSKRSGRGTPYRQQVGIFLSRRPLIRSQTCRPLQLARLMRIKYRRS
jgi:hypothetical protein